MVEIFSQGLVPSKLRPQHENSVNENPVNKPSLAATTNISKIPDSLTLPVETIPAPLLARPQPKPQVAVAEIEASSTANDSAEYQTTPRQPIKVVQPTYPKLAEWRRIEGDVDLELQVDSRGNVQNVRTLRGDSLLGEAAEQAARQWQFSRSPENQAVSTVTRVRFYFRLPTETNQ
jgi:TonB family protein